MLMLTNTLRQEFPELPLRMHVTHCQGIQVPKQGVPSPTHCGSSSCRKLAILVFWTHGSQRRFLGPSRARFELVSGHRLVAERCSFSRLSGLKILNPQRGDWRCWEMILTSGYTVARMGIRPISFELRACFESPSRAWASRLPCFQGIRVLR